MSLSFKWAAADAGIDVSAAASYSMAAEDPAGGGRKGLSTVTSRSGRTTRRFGLKPFLDEGMEAKGRIGKEPLAEFEKHMQEQALSIRLHHFYVWLWDNLN